MKKIFSILILAVATILSASAAQTITLTTKSNSSSVGFRVNKMSNISSSYFRYGSGNFQRAFNAGTSFGITTETNYYNVSGAMKTNTTLTIYIASDDLTHLEIVSGADQITAVNVSGAATTLSSLILRGCTNLTTLTLGTMSTLTDLDVSNTSAAVANAITASNCPNLENLNVANCNLTSLGYTGTGLYALDVTGNNITTLDISSFSKLDILRCEGNTMTSLTLPSSVTTVSAQSNSLSGVSGYGEPLTILDVASNNLESLSMEGITGLTDLDISSNHLTFRSFPSVAPARVRYTGNDGQYDLSDQMKAAYGRYSYPLQSMIPNYNARTNAEYTLDLSDALLDGHNEKNVTAVVNCVAGGTLTALTKSNSSVDNGDYAVDTDKDYYGFLKPQEQVRISFTDASYPNLTLYSNDFTVPSGVPGTLKIVDEEGAELYTNDNAFFSDATDGLPADARRDYTQYTYPALPTTPGGTWTVIAAPSDDAPFGWAKSYDNAVWYYLNMKGKYVTSGEQLYELGGSQTYNGHKLKDTYDTSDNNYQWAFVGNQYSGFKIYNKGRGSGETLQDYSGYWTPATGGLFPVMKSGESLTWIARTNSSGTGFSLENKGGGTDNTNGGASAPCFLNDFEGRGAMNYWITSIYDAQNDAGSLFNVTKAADANSSIVKWVIVDGNNTPIYTVTSNVTPGATISAYPSELTSLTTDRYVTLNPLTSFTANSGTTVKRIGYTWNGLFNISDANTVHYYNLAFVDYTQYYYGNTNCFIDLLSATTGTDDALTMVANADGTDTQYQWAFFGDPFNGFTIKNRFTGKTLYHNNALSNSGVPILSDANATTWTALKSTHDGSGATANVSDIATAYESAMTLSYDSFFLMNYGNTKLLKFYTNAQADKFAGVKLTFVESVDVAKTITWRVKNGETVLIEEPVTYTTGTEVTTYPTALTEWAAQYANRYVELPTLTPFTVTENGVKELSYAWTGPFTPSTDSDKHWYNVKVHNKYLYADATASVDCKLWDIDSPLAAYNFVWAFIGNPFDGFMAVPYGNQNMNLSSTGIDGNNKSTRLNTDGSVWQVTKISDTEFNVKHPNADSYWNDYSGVGRLANWQQSTVDGSKVTVEPADLSNLLLSGYYRIHSAAEGYTDIYMSVDEENNAMCNNRKYDKSTDMQYTVFCLDEQTDGTFVISKNGYYLKGANSATTNSEEAANCNIAYNSTYNAFTIQIASGNYGYANIDTWTSELASYSLEARSTWIIEPVVPVTLNAVGDNSYATFYYDRDVQTDEDTKAYYITSTSNGYAQLTEVSNEGHDIPAYTAVVLINSAKATNAIFTVTSGLSSVVSEDANLLKGTLTSMSLDLSDATNYYSMGKKDDKIGFYKFSGGSITLGANKAYLDTTAPGGAVKGFVFDFDDATSINEELRMKNEESNVEAIYDLSGRKINGQWSIVNCQLPKGIYIINGKKTIIK